MEQGGKGKKTVPSRPETDREDIYKNIYTNAHRRATLPHRTHARRSPGQDRTVTLTRYTNPTDASLILSADPGRPLDAMVSAMQQFASVVGRVRTARSWICVNCRNSGPIHLPRRAPPTLRAPRRRQYTTSRQHANPPKPGRQRRTAVLVAAATTGTTVAVGAAFADDVKYAYAAAERAGRVAATLAICVNE